MQIYLERSSLSYAYIAIKIPVMLSETIPISKATIVSHSRKLDHPVLVKLLQEAYSAEKAAAYAYQGHAASVRKQAEKIAIRQIEEDEWNHRKEVLEIMNCYSIPVSKWLEYKYSVVGRSISASCHVIGWFMPFFFAGKLESGNVCAYFQMKQYFNSMGIHEWDIVLYEMGIKEKEHEIYFLNKIKESRVLPYFERVFNWGKNKSANNVDLDKKYPVEQSDVYCKISKQ
jgi:demethoxyubiquinone hydroxylase (CLK1/Coq7/Cat5 family)